ncbi:MAG: ABC transporter ATP-binding protein [Alphaproteobacteria bacterium]|nr:ABC transporter ATP-binding protein [Alphaproteobacteria bacterium]
MTAIIKLENVTVKYGHNVALRDISGEFQAGSLTAIAGPNGAGKSSLLKAIAGIIKPAAGSITISPNDRIAYLSQASSMRRDFPMSALKAVCSGFWSTSGNSGSITSQMKDKAAAALSEMGLNGMEYRQISDLSGGQFQRLLFARVMIENAPIVLLDEPFAAIDAETTVKLIKILLDWHRQGHTIICVLHDLLLIQKYFPDSFVLAGKCLCHGHTHNLLEQKLLSFDLDMAELCAGPETEGHKRHD